MKCFFWSADNDGCGFYRMHEPARVLELLAHETNVSTRFTPTWNDADVVVGQRVFMPGPSQRWEQMAEQGRFLVYDVDDDLFSVDPFNPSHQVFSNPEVRHTIARNASLASRVTTCSERIAEVMSRFSKDVRVIPNGLPADILTWERSGQESDVVTVGWAGTSQTLPELRIVSGRLERFLARTHPGSKVKLATLGVTAQQTKSAGLKNPAVQHKGWVKGTENYLRAVDFDIWLAPYRITPFNQAKAATKALEAAFLGIPIIASSTSPYERFVRHGETGFLVRRDHEWDLFIRALVEDTELRQRMGEAARRQAVEHITEGLAPAWESALTPGGSK